MSNNPKIQLQVSKNSEFTPLLVDKTVDDNDGQMPLILSDFSTGGGGTEIPYGETLYSRVRHSSDSGSSQWGSVVNFALRRAWSQIFPGVGMDVGTGTNITSDSGYNLSPNFGIITLTESKILVLYKDTNYRTFGQIFEIVQGIITYGTPAQISTGWSRCPSGIKLTQNKVVVTWQHDNGNGPAQIRVVNINNSQLLLGPVITNGSSNTNADYPLLCKISDINFLMVYSYENGVQDLYAQLFTISEETNTITITNTTQCTNHNSVRLSISKLSDMQYIVSYMYRKSTTVVENLRTILLTISETNKIIAGPSINLGYRMYRDDAQAETNHHIFGISPTLAVLAVSKRIDAKLYLQLLHINNNTITIGDCIQCTNYKTWYPHIVRPMEDRLVILHSNIDDGNKFYSVLVEIDGDTFVPYPPTKCSDINVREPVGDVLTEDVVASVYQHASTKKLQFQLLHGVNF